MPYKFETDKKQIKSEDDKRIKLTDVDRIEIRKLYDTGDYSQRKLASAFKVSRRLISFILDPEKLEKNKKARGERGGSKIYYEKEKQKRYMKAHRSHKKELNKDGKLQ